MELEQQESFNETQEFSTGRKRKDSEGHTPNRTLGGQRIHRNNRTRSFHTHTRLIHRQTDSTCVGLYTLFTERSTTRALTPKRSESCVCPTMIPL